MDNTFDLQFSPCVLKQRKPCILKVRHTSAFSPHKSLRAGMLASSINLRIVIAMSVTTPKRRKATAKQTLMGPTRFWFWHFSRVFIQLLLLFAPWRPRSLNCPWWFHNEIWSWSVPDEHVFLWILVFQLHDINCSGANAWHKASMEFLQFMVMFRH